MTDVTRLETAKMRSIAYKHLSLLYYVPDPTTLGRLDDLASVLDCLLPDAHEQLVLLRKPADLDELTIDFTRLFLGPFKLLAPPYGSVYLEGKREIMGATTLDAQAQYRRAGLDFSEAVKEVPDHVALELEFLYYLTFQEAEALEREDVTDVAIWQERQSAFLSRHLGIWVSDFADATEKGATTEFYRSLAQITKMFVAHDQARLNLTSSEPCQIAL